MNHSKSFLLCLILLFLSCSKQNEVSISEKNFDLEVPVVGNMEFTFNKNLMPDSLLGLWDTIEYIKFDPAIRGRFKWSSSNELVFSPINELPPATEFEGVITDEVLAFEKKLSFGEKKFEFHTPYLQLISVKAYWALLEEDEGEPVVKVDFNFNFDVSAEEVIKLLKIEIEGSQKNLNLLNTGRGQMISGYLSDIKMEEDDLEASFSISKGLNAVNGSIPTDEEITYELMLRSPFRLSIEDVYAEHDGTEGQIMLTTSQQLTGGNIAEFVKVEPEVDFTVEVSIDGFIIKSEDFKAKMKYEITIIKGLLGRIGGELMADYKEQVIFGELEPSIKFVNSKAVYLSGTGNKNIAANIINIPKVKVRISKIYENNILAAMRYGYHSNWDNDYYYEDEYYDYEYDYYDYYDYYGTNNLGDVIWEKEYETKMLPRQGNFRLLKMDFLDKINDYKGFYVVEIVASDKHWLKTQRFISISDIGLIVKEGKKSVLVFANSLKTAKPMANVEISLIGTNNQVIKIETTDNDGVAEIKLDKNLVGGFKPTLITARSGEDFNYLPFSRTRVGTSRFEVGGKRENSSGYDAFIYGDRDIYRPGEKIHLSAVVRDFEWKTPGEIPVKLKFVMPNGKLYKTVKSILNEQGAFETEISMPAAAATGTYTAEVYTSNNILLNAKRIAVEEFMPDRIKVEANLDKEEMMSGESVRVDILATNLFGPPAADRNYEVEMSLKRRYFNSSKHRGYNFSIEKTNTYFRSILREGDTDAEGRAAEEFQVSSKFDNMGMLQSDFFVTVFDETGRPVNRRKSITIYTQDVFYGIKYFDSYGRLNQEVNIPLIAVDKDGNALDNVETTIELIKYEWKTVLARSGSYYRYKSQREEILLETKKIRVNGKSTLFSFVPELSGQYEIRVSKPGVNSYVKRNFYAYGYGSTSSSSFEVNNEGHIEIELDKELYKVGEKAKVLLTTPFSGKILVTIESDKVLKHYYVNTDKKSAMIEIEADKDYLPNVYITATLFRPHGESDIPLTVAHGFAPMFVEDDNNKLPIAIEAVEKSRSKTKQTIKIKSEPNASITVAVVDEGILQITGYTTPDPYEFFYQKRALAVNSYNVYPYLFPELTSKLTRPGGGMALEKRVNPLTNKRVILVALWSGILKTNSRGEVSYDINIPQFSGDLRIMAVVYKNDGFASGHTNMKVADPIVISSSLPRFLSPRDTVIMPVTLSNTTKKSAKAKVKLKVDGIVKAIGSSSSAVSIKSNSESRVVFKAVAEPGIGHAKFTVQVEAMGEVFTEETDMTIRPPSTLQKISGSGSLQGGKTQKIEMGVSKFIPSSMDFKLIVSRSPLVQFAKDLDYLVRYPYGCVEQITSKAFPQLYYHDLVKGLLQGEEEDPNPNYHVQETIRLLMMRQVYDGGLSYWPGGGHVNWWSTVYAAHFLVEAQKAGFEVDKSMLDKMYKYLRMKLKSRETMTYYYNRIHNRKIAPKEVAYSLYVLAIAGKPEKSTMNYYKAHPDLLSLDSKYLLAAAYALSGDKNKYKQIVPNAFEGEESNTSFGGSFYSYIRDEAIALNALLEVDPDNPQVGIMAKHISQALKTKRYLNTQERSFGFLALGKVARMAAKGNVTAAIKVNGKVASNFSGTTTTYSMDDLGGTSIEVSASGKGSLYYFWEAEGISVDGSYKEEDNFIKVRKYFYDRYGRRITDNTFEQNDLIVVKLTIQGITNTFVENIVMTDILPAGFEIENPRISEVPGTNWAKSSYSYDHQDIRDDRITFFVNVSGTEKRYFYVLRAVSLGTFQMGPVGADAMYDGEYHSYSGGGVIRVIKKGD